MGKHETGYERAAGDFYPTPSWATEALLSHINIRGLAIWECAAGAGDMSEVLKAAGARVYSSDIVDRGYPLDAQIDFIAPHPAGLPAFHGTVTNPPFGLRGTLAVAFIETALLNLNDGFCVFLLPSDYDCAKTRTYLFGDCPQFRCKIVRRKRCKWFDGPDSKSPKENHAWFGWGDVPFKRVDYSLPTIRYAPL